MAVPTVDDVPDVRGGPAGGPSALTPEYVPGQPHPALAGYVTGYTGYREQSANAVRRRQAPYGGCPLILAFGEPLRLDGPAGATSATSFLAGMHDAAVMTEYDGAQSGVEVQLTPLGVFVLLGRPMTDFTNQCPSLDALEAPDLARLPDRLAADADWPTRFARIDVVLRRRLDWSATRPDPLVAWAWQRLQDTGGGARITELASYTGWSRRHLLERFRAQVGLGPKATARVLRFSRAAGLLVPPGADGGPPATLPTHNLADVAAACGYTDHSHLVREFRDLAGVTPSQYVAEWRLA